jgi:hypothetical protein
VSTGPLGAPLVGDRRQVLAGRADGEQQRLPEVLEVRVVGARGERAATYVLEPGALHALGDVALGGAGHPPLVLDGRVELPHRGREGAQHRHPAGVVSHVQTATVPRGAWTRAISRTPGRDRA